MKEINRRPVPALDCCKGVHRCAPAVFDLPPATIIRMSEIDVRAKQDYF